MEGNLTGRSFACKNKENIQWIHFPLPPSVLDTVPQQFPIKERCNSYILLSPWELVTLILWPWVSSQYRWEVPQEKRVVLYGKAAFLVGKGEEQASKTNVCFGVEKQQRIQRHQAQHANKHWRLAGWGAPLGNAVSRVSVRTSTYHTKTFESFT